MQPDPVPAFTLIELLVVVTIIVVLLAMLTPALDKAIYQAELVVCASRLHATGTGSTVYAMDQRRRYPYRLGLHETNVWQPYMLNLIPSLSEVYKDDRTTPAVGGYDDRPMLRGYIAINKMLNDPFCAPVNLETTQLDSMVTASYDLWFGWGYKKYAGNAAENAAGQKITTGRGMFKLGDRFDWEGRAFDLLGGDMDLVESEDNAVIGSHPEGNGFTINQVLQDESTAGKGASAGGLVLGAAGAKFTLSRWIGGGTYKRGLIDSNYAHADGSVIRFAEVKYNDPNTPGSIDPRMAHVPHLENGGHYPGNWHNVPAP